MTMVDNRLSRKAFDNIEDYMERRSWSESDRLRIRSELNRERILYEVTNAALSIKGMHVQYQDRGLKLITYAEIGIEWK